MIHFGSNNKIKLSSGTTRKINITLADSGNIGVRFGAKSPPVLYAPTLLIATTISNTRIDLAWQDNNSGASAYSIERSADGLIFAVIDATPIGANTYSDTTCNEAETYYYRVRANLGTIYSAYSNIANATTILLAPTNLVLTVISSTEIDLLWDNNTLVADGVSIERSIDGINFVEIDTVLAAIDTYSDTTCNPSTQYWYRVRAYRGAVYSDYSNTDDDTTPSSYDADLLTYISGLATPLSAGQLTLLNTLITTIKTGLSITNLSDAFDVLYVLGGETAESSLRNLVKRAHDGTAVNSPTFTALEGFTGDGASSYIQTNYVPVDDAVNLSTSSVTIGGYCRTGRNAAARYLMGGRSVASNNRRWLINLKISDAADSTVININAATNVTFSPLGAAQTRGFTFGVRDASNIYAIKNKSWSSAAPSASLGLPDLMTYLLAYNNLGTPASFETEQISLMIIARKFNTTEIDTIVDAFEAYMDANGKGVLP